MSANKTLERKLRRALEKRGFRLCKSRIHSINADNYGGYMIVDNIGNYVVAGARFEMDLDDVATWLGS